MKTENMTFSEALEAMKQRYKVKRKDKQDVHFEKVEEKLQ